MSARHAAWTALTLAALAAASTPGSRAASSAGFGADPLWDDGRAEYSQYGGRTQRYGEPRPTSALMVVVKEDLVRETLVKSDAGPKPGRTFEALKFNVISTFTTGSYEYHQMASVFFDRATLEVVKLATTHSEACGITTVRVAPRHGKWMHEARSYWEGEADRDVPLRWPSVDRPRVMADALPVWLRGELAAGRTRGTRELWLLPGQVSGRSPLGNTQPVAATLRFASGEAETVPAGRFMTWRATVKTPHGTLEYWFDERAPYVLVRLEEPARTLELRRTQRLDYWNHHAEGDERLVE